MPHCNYNYVIILSKIKYTFWVWHDRLILQMSHDVSHSYQNKLILLWVYTLLQHRKLVSHDLQPMILQHLMTLYMFHKTIGHCHITASFLCCKNSEKCSKHATRPFLRGMGVGRETNKTAHSGFFQTSNIIITLQQMIKAIFLCFSFISFAHSNQLQQQNANLNCCIFFWERVID